MTRGIYRKVIRHDMLGTWLMPAFRARYAEPRATAAASSFRAPKEFTAGVGRLGHGLVREIYPLNDESRSSGCARCSGTPAADDPRDAADRGLAGGFLPLLRHRSLGAAARPVARAARGPTLRRRRRPVGRKTRTVSSCVISRPVRAVGSLGRIADLPRRPAEPRLFEGCFARDEACGRRRWPTGWPTPASAPARSGGCRRSAAHPLPDARGRGRRRADNRSGALGSVLMGETLAAAPSARDAGDTRARRGAARGLRRAAVPASMAEIVRFLQRHYRFPEGARLHPAEARPPRLASAASPVRPPPEDRNVRHLNVAPPAGPPGSRWPTTSRSAGSSPSGRPSRRPGPATVRRAAASSSTASPWSPTGSRRRVRAEHARPSRPALPAKEIDRGEPRADVRPLGDGRYPLPQFYADHYRPGFGPVMTPLDTLLARVGDYTIAQCR